MTRATTRRRDIDARRVRAAVEEAERVTSAEIVVAIAPFFFGKVWRAARRAFEKLGVGNTERRNGVLVFLVPARRQVIVLPDVGADLALDPMIWRDVAQHIATSCAHGHGTHGVVDGIQRLAQSLARVFPRHANDINELPDAIVTLGRGARARARLPRSRARRADPRSRRLYR
jgi:uncharacterized membrane protein